MNYLERAQKGVDDLEAVITRLNNKPVGMDAPFHGAKVGNQTCVNGVPLAFIQKAEEVVTNILLYVSALDTPVQDGIAGWAPDWWEQTKRTAADQRNENGDTTRFADAVALVQRMAEVCLSHAPNGGAMRIETPSGSLCVCYLIPQPHILWQQSLLIVTKCCLQAFESLPGRACVPVKSFPHRRPDRSRRYLRSTTDCSRAKRSQPEIWRADHDRTCEGGLCSEWLRPKLVSSPC